MVAAEAAAAGALPVCAEHSGPAEVAGALAAELPAAAGELTSFPLAADAVVAIADRLHRWLALPAAERGRGERRAERHGRGPAGAGRASPRRSLDGLRGATSTSCPVPDRRSEPA